MRVGDHALAAVAEWHIHAGDVARSFRLEYRPTTLRSYSPGDGSPPPFPRQPAWTASLLAAGRRP